jgi:hypothetical protein
MKKIIFILLFLCAFTLNAQVLTGRGVRLYPKDTSTVKSTWVYITQNGKQDSLFLYDHNVRHVLYPQSSTTSGSGLDTIYRTQGKDSIQFTIAGRYHAILDSTAGNRAYIRLTTMLWENVSAVDSVLQLYVPVGKTIQIDSVYALQDGASAMTINVKKIHSGSSSDILSSNQSVTTSITAGTGIQNNTLVAFDQLWVCLRSITGTALHAWVQIVYEYL